MIENKKPELGQSYIHLEFFVYGYSVSQCVQMRTDIWQNREIDLARFINNNVFLDVEKAENQRMKIDRAIIKYILPYMNTIEADKTLTLKAKEHKPITISEIMNKNDYNCLPLNELVEKIEQWGTDKGILNIDIPNEEKKTQLTRMLLKTVEELGELSSAVLKEKKEEIIDGIGDVLVTLILFAAQANININYALNDVYNIIAKRTGKLIDGVFVKDEDIK